MSGRGAARGSERSAESGRVIHSRCLQRARERRAGRCRRICFDRREPAGRQMVRSTSRPSSIPFYACAGRGDDGARAVGPTDDDDVGVAWSGGGVRAQRGTYGVIDQRRPNSAAVTWGAWPRSFYDVWSGCSARLGTISRIWPRYPFSLPSTRAREASGAMSTDLLRPARAAWAADGEVDVAAVVDSFLRIADRGDDGARAVGPTDDDDVGFAWSGRRRASAARYLRGHRSTPAKFCSSDMGRLASLVLRCLVGVQRAARNDQQNLAALSILVAFNARARGERGDVDGFVRPARAGWAADGEVDVAAVVDSFLRIADRGDDGARAVGPTDDDDVGFAWSAAACERSEVPTGSSINAGQILQQ